ncbi:Pentatricopeptide repeat-containing protein [Thalictrum thalictroides]|uniref:Pentatricopeptide repeat-containing protein n=1 Tax=Thalictrum thalictroides TaxID=46969 RepID=A0A7J6X294_THATH|nr:Pentatricopeptide repeat-containing protein [Thalictrum thalictroides]
MSSSSASSAAKSLCRIFSKRTTSKPVINPKPTKPTPTHKSLVDKLFKEKNLSTLVKKFIKCSENPRFRGHHNIYEDTVRRLASAKKFSCIEQVLEHQKKYEDITTEGFAMRLISLYGKAGMLDHASKLFDELPQLKCQRTLKSFNSLLYACVQSKQFDKTEKLFRELSSSLSLTPDIVSYNIVIQAFSEMGSLDSAELMLGEMESNGVKPNLITYNTIINRFFHNGKFSDGERFWARMEESGIVPDVITYNAKIKGLVYGGKIAEAVELVEQLESSELEPNHVTYNLLIEGYCNDGNSDEAKTVYDHMLKTNYVPNRTTFEALIPCIYENGDLDLALKLCLDSVNSNCLIDVGVLQVVVDGLAKVSRIEEAKNFVKLARSKKYNNSKLKMPSEDD